MAVLEDGRAIAEYEVDGARNGAVAVELAVDVGVQGVLVPVYLAVVDYRSVRGHTEGHSLVVLRTRGVFDPEVLCHKVVPIGRNCGRSVSSKAPDETLTPGNLRLCRTITKQENAICFLRNVNILAIYASLDIYNKYRVVALFRRVVKCFVNCLVFSRPIFRDDNIRLHSC